jgi:xanthine/uracil permease
LAGVSVVVFGLIAVSGIKIWVDNQVDFSKNHNLILGAAVLIVGTNDFTLHLGAFTLGGIGVATFGAMGLHALLKMGAKNDV